MGRNKNKKKNTQNQVEGGNQMQQLMQQMQNLPPEMQQQLQMMMANKPTKEDIDKKGKLYFGQVKRPVEQITQQEMDELQSYFGDNWFAEITEKIRSKYIFNEQNEPSIAIEPIFTEQQVRLILKMGTKLLSRSHNVEDILVPGSTIQEFQSDLPKQYKELLPADFGLQSLPKMKPIELKYNTPQIPTHPHLILVGDTHGTFEVLETIFAREGLPNEKTVYLFNGDYVDRGSFSTEVYLCLLIFKLLSPKSLYMLRGNHETETVCTNYSLKEELQRKYKDQGEELFKLFIKSFQALPVAAIINNSYYVVHGGISGWRDFDSDMIYRLNRFRDPESALSSYYESFDPLNDILWSDPTEQISNIQFNASRGSSIMFGNNAIRKFLRSSSLQFLVRSHQCVPNGYELLHNGHTMTLFSVPNYNEKNLGAYAVLYGLYDGNKQATEEQKRSLNDSSPLGLYVVRPSMPLCFIRQFNCSDHAAILNQPIIREIMLRQWTNQMMAQAGK